MASSASVKQLGGLVAAKPPFSLKAKPNVFSTKSMATFFLQGLVFFGFTYAKWKFILIHKLPWNKKNHPSKILHVSGEINKGKQGSCWVESHRRVWGCWRIAPLFPMKDPDLGHVSAQHKAALNPFTLTHQCDARMGKPPPLCSLRKGWGEKHAKQRRRKRKKKFFWIPLRLLLCQSGPLKILNK